MPTEIHKGEARTPVPNADLRVLITRAASDTSKRSRRECRRLVIDAVYQCGYPIGQAKTLADQFISERRREIAQVTQGQGEQASS
jgi:hypothetical protein